MSRKILSSNLQPLAARFGSSGLAPITLSSHGPGKTTDDPPGDAGKSSPFGFRFASEKVTCWNIHTIPIPHEILRKVILNPANQSRFHPARRSRDLERNSRLILVSSSRRTPVVRIRHRMFGSHQGLDRLLSIWAAGKIAKRVKVSLSPPWETRCRGCRYSTSQATWPAV